MSRAKRRDREGERDVYPTPAWCVHRLLDRVVLPGGEWLEPAVGDGAIVRAVDEYRHDVRWTTADIRDTGYADMIMDFTGEDALNSEMACMDVIITNPPYNKALDFVITSICLGKIVVMLLRVNWLASQRRQPFLRRHMPDVYVLPNRPSFTGTGTDATEYGWFVWGGGHGGKIDILGTTPLKERK